MKKHKHIKTNYSNTWAAWNKSWLPICLVIMLVARAVACASYSRTTTSLASTTGSTVVGYSSTS